MHRSLNTKRCIGKREDGGERIESPSTCYKNEVFKLEEIGYYLGLKPDEFWTFTFREFEIYAKQQFKRIENTNDSNNEKVAVLMAHIANLFSKKKGGGIYKSSDFFKKKKVESKPMDINVMAEILKAITIANGGEVIG